MGARARGGGGGGGGQSIAIKCPRVVTQFASVPTTTDAVLLPPARSLVQGRHSVVTGNPSAVVHSSVPTCGTQPSESPE